MPNKPDMQKPVKPIDKLELAKVNRLRARIAKVLGGAVAIGALGGGVGHLSGEYVQGKWEDATSDFREDEEESEKSEDEEESKGKTVSEKEKPKKKETWGKKAERMVKERIRKTQKWASKEAGKKIDELPVIREYKQAVREMNELKQIILEKGDQIAYWAPFLIMFLVTIKLARLTISAHRGIKDFLDPERSKKLDAVESKVNEMIERLNTLSEHGRAGMPPNYKEEIAGLEAGFAQLTARIDAGLKEGGGGEEEEVSGIINVNLPEQPPSTDKAVG